MLIRVTSFHPSTSISTQKILNTSLHHTPTSFTGFLPLLGRLKEGWNTSFWVIWRCIQYYIGLKGIAKLLKLFTSNGILNTIWLLQQEVMWVGHLVGIYTEEVDSKIDNIFVFVFAWCHCCRQRIQAYRILILIGLFLHRKWWHHL